MVLLWYHAIVLLWKAVDEVDAFEFTKGGCKWHDKIMLSPGNDGSVVCLRRNDVSVRSMYVDHNLCRVKYILRKHKTH